MGEQVRVGGGGREDGEEKGRSPGHILRERLQMRDSEVTGGGEVGLAGEGSESRTPPSLASFALPPSFQSLGSYFRVTVVVIRFPLECAAVPLLSKPRL